jgi:hypothetical protein
MINHTYAEPLFIMNNHHHLFPLKMWSTYFIIRLMVTYLTIKNLTLFMKLPFFPQLIIMCIIFHVNIK